MLRAARALAAAAEVRAPLARLHLEKNLPVASGIGGGSADAAATLRLLGRNTGGFQGLSLKEVALGTGCRCAGMP